MKKKNSIPPEIADKVLFLADRTCCVCRIPPKFVQIHHLDGNPKNNKFDNLSVLCFDCHQKTQIKGGFDRKLNANQIILYRDNWYSIVNMKRAPFIETKNKDKKKNTLKIATSLAEIYKENKQYELLAIHYDCIGNKKLRDKYIEIAIKKNPTDQNIVFLRSLQGKQNKISKKIIEREFKRYTKNKDWSQRARFHQDIGKHLEAAKDYIYSIKKSLDNKSIFSAAFYLKEMVGEGVIENLFIEALKNARKEKDLWWEVRALEELGWKAELKKLLKNNVKKIRKSGNTMLLLLLAKLNGQEKREERLIENIAKGTRFLFSKDKRNIQKKKKGHLRKIQGHNT